MTQSLAERYPRRATVWQLRSRTLAFGTRPLLMGIVNVTPDSFSDGGKFLSHQRAIGHAEQLIEDGADIIDIGGESTRPYSTPVSAVEELERVLPVLQAIAPRGIVSIDTSKAFVARAALDAGAEVINDITGLASADMLSLALESRAGVCVMHMQGNPQTMQDDPHYADVVDDIYRWLEQRRDALLSAGLARERLCLDPGIGFGKTHQHNLTLAANCWRFHELGCPLLVGHSRKGFIGKVLGDKEADRTFGTLGISLALASQGMQILRVHDVKSTREALQLFEAAGGIDGRATNIERSK
jgi:dihydropteroate synthase